MLNYKVLNIKFLPPIFLEYLTPATSFNIGIKPKRVSDSTKNGNELFQVYSIKIMTSRNSCYLLKFD